MTDDHYESCPMPDPARFRYYVSPIGRTPIWECTACGVRHTYVECECDVAHDCEVTE